jgi:amino acid transporter
VHDDPVTQLRPAMGLRDVVLFFVTAVLSIRWMASAAAAGPSGLTIWVIALLAFFIPLAFTVIELGSRYPDEGGIYVWTKRAFGDFAGFLTGWTYWASNLVYFPSLLYYSAATALYIHGRPDAALAGSASYFIIFSLVGLTLATWLNIIGLNIAKWLHNLGAIFTWIPVGILLVAAGISWHRFGIATRFTLHSLAPTSGLKDIIFWSTIAFAFAGLEAGSIMGGEVVDARRTIPRAIVISGIIITAVYIMGTASILIAIPHDQVTALDGVMQAIATALQRSGMGGLSWVAAIMIAISGVAGVGAWIAASGRLPFVAGIDRYLPSAFARIHPRWRTPWISILVQAVLAAVFTILGQAGSSVKGAYDALVSLSVISFFIPYLFMFAAMIRLQREPAGPGVIRVPGGRGVAVMMGGIGFTTTLISIGLALVPPPDATDRTFAVLKVVGMSTLLVVAGIVLYGIGLWRRNHTGMEKVTAPS